MQSMGELVILSYINARIDIYSFNKKMIIHTIEAISEPLKLIQCNSNYIAIGSTEAFELNLQESLPVLNPI